MQLFGRAPLLTIGIFAKVAVVITVLFCADSLAHTFLASLTLTLLPHQQQGSVSLLHHPQASVMAGLFS